MPNIANGLTLPQPLSNGTTNDAVPVMADFNYLLTALNRALLDAGGGSGMNAQNVLIHNLGPGVAGTDAVNLSQLGGYALLTGATFTGSVGFSGTTLNLSGAATLAAITGTTLSLSSTLGVTGASTLAAISGTTLNLSGLATLAGITASGALSLTGALTTGTAVNSVGFLGTPPNAQTVNYQLVLADSGKTVDMNGTNLTLTIPANSGTAFPIGAIILGTNLNATNLTIAITTDTLIWSGTTTTGSRTVGQNGEFKLKKVAATVWLASGTAMS